MATYYVDKVGSQLKYRSGAWPDESNGTVPSPNTLNQIAFALTGSDTVVLAPRTYVIGEINTAGPLALGRAGQTWRNPISQEGKTGAVILDGAGLAGNVVSFNAAITFSGIDVKNADTNYSNVYFGVTGTTLNDVVLNGGYKGFNVAAPATFNRVTVKNTTAFIGDINATGASLTWNYGWVIDNTGNGIRVLNGNFTYSNLTGVGQSNETIVVSGNNAQQVTGKNNIWHGPTGNPAKYALLNSSGNAICSETNSIIGYNPFGPAYLTSGFTLNTVTTDKSPLFKATKRKGVVSIVIDDAESSATFAALAPLMEARGFRGTWALNTSLATSNNLWSAARSYVASGHEIASHGRSHSKVTATSAISIQYVGAGSACTITIDNTAKTLTTSVTGASHNLSIDLTQYTLNGLAVYLNAYGGGGVYSVFVVDTSNNEARSEHLASVSGQSIKAAAYTASLNQNQYLTYEVNGSKTDIETNIPGYTCKSFVYPYFATDATAKAQVAGAGFIGARVDSSGTKLFTDIEAYAVYGNHVGGLFGLTSTNPTAAQIKGRVAALVEYLDWSGGIVVILAHLTNGTNDYDMTNWGHVLDALRESQANVLTFGSAMQYIAANAETTSGSGGTLHYQRSAAHLGDSSNYRLQSTSPAINAGTGVSLTTDADGKPILGTPDIGAYEYYPLDIANSPDLVRELLTTAGISATSNPDMLRVWLASKVGYTGALNDMWLSYLNTLGYTSGSLEDRIYQANIDGRIFS